MIEDLKINEDQAEAILDKAIEFEVYTDEMPDSKKDKISEAHEIVAFAIDSWVEDGADPDSDDEGKAAAGQQIQEILELAGVSIDEDNDITYGDVPDGDEEPVTSGGDDEGPFDINDVIEGYEELTVASRVRAIKKLDLDPEKDEDYNVLVAIEDFENESDEPAGRVLTLIEELLPTDDADGDDDETAAEAGDDEGEDDEEESEEPWEDYDSSKLADIKEVLADDDRTVEECEYVLEYETAKDKPRIPVIKAIKARIDELSQGGVDVDEELPTEKALMKMPKDDLRAWAEKFEVEFPRRFTDTGRQRVVAGLLASNSTGSGSDDPDDEDDVDEAVARDDAKDTKRKATSKGKGGVDGDITLTREQILEALSEGEVTIG